MDQCPWSEVLTGVAWSIWHNEGLFSEMKEQLTMRVLPPGRKVAMKDKVAWMEWLAEKNDKRTAYNIHELWTWYAKRFIVRSD